MASKPIYQIYAELQEYKPKIMNIKEKKDWRF